MKNYNMKKIELYIDKVLETKELGDSIDWLVDLGTINTSGDELVDNYANEMESYTLLIITQLSEENYEFCGKVRDAIEIITEDIQRLIKMKKLDEDEKYELLKEIEFIYDVYKLSLKKLIEDFI